MSALVDVVKVYQGSDGDATRALHARLEELGDAGRIGAYLVRAQKASERAKVYRGGGYRRQAYDRKEWALGELCAVLQADAAGLTWGWGEDPDQPVYRHVLYVDLPTGQVSFHAAHRGAGPDYAGAWDGRPGQAPDRILRWLARLLEGRA